MKIDCEEMDIDHARGISSRPAPIPHFTADTDIRYLLSISDTGILINQY